MRHRHAIACLLLVLAAPQLGGCIAALVGGVAVGASAAHDRRGVGGYVDDKRIYLGAYDAFNKDKELALHNNVTIVVYHGVMLLVGMKFYNKASAHDDVQARLIELCEGDAQCQTAVRTHYDACFDSAYNMCGRRSGSKLDVDALVSCVNRKAGEDYFAVDETKK